MVHIMVPPGHAALVSYFCFIVSPAQNFVQVGTFLT